jgi:adenine-specific DNA-methyltransferase
VLVEQIDCEQLEIPLGYADNQDLIPRPSLLQVPRRSRGQTGGAFRQQLLLLKDALQETGSVQSVYRSACGATRYILAVYWSHLQRGQGEPWPLPALGSDAPPLPSAHVRKLLDDLGKLVALAAKDEPIAAGYMIGEIYTALLPSDFRARHGIFYTPPALSDRLVHLASSAGVDWATASVLDPSCGGGAFLTPVAIRIVSALGSKNPRDVLNHVSTHLHGFELDPFGAWMSQVLLESALMDLCRHAGTRLPNLVTVCDALAHKTDERKFDLVIGNPPYGRLTLEPEVRELYRRSLHGHANAYGLFMDLGVRWARAGGVLAYITPTGFLGGRYFKELRHLMAKEAPPVAIDLVTSRRGVFSNVLQETLLAAYCKGGESVKARVHILSLRSEAALDVSSVGSFSLPVTVTDPWLIPRDSRQADLVSRLHGMAHRLSDYGYKVSTGPLVWNRHKPQLHMNPVSASYPIIWAESVASDGRFLYRTEQKNHKPYVKLKSGQEWLLTQEPCVLVQRTTAKEQSRRLLAAELPGKFIRKHGAVVVENHLNMVRPICAKPKVSLRVLAALLNSEVADMAFRCISGSVAVSATELESLPLPPPESMRRLEDLLEAGTPREVLQDCIRDLYMREPTDVAA